MKYNTLTHIGKREVNQDVILIKNIDPDTYLYIIADGMGGYDNGEVAAKAATESISTFLSNIDKINKETIQKAINKANLAVRQLQEKNNSQMGTTLGAVIISKNIAKCFWVGDVKILQYSEGKLAFESKSHNLLNEISENDAFKETFNSSKYSHIVTRSIQGNVKKSVISYQELMVNENDQLIICSDGVHNIVDSQTMLFLMNNIEDSNSFIHHLNERLKDESDDNASLVYIKN